MYIICVYMFFCNNTIYDLPNGSTRASQISPAMQYIYFAAEKTIYDHIQWCIFEPGHVRDFSPSFMHTETLWLFVLGARLEVANIFSAWIWKEKTSLILPLNFQ